MEGKDELPGFERPISFGYDPWSLSIMDCTYTRDNTKDNETMDRHLVICGLHFGTHGRNCENHDVCGKHVRVCDRLRIKLVNVSLESGVLQERIGVYSTVEHGNGCLVGFLSPSYYKCIEIHNAIQSGLDQIAVIRIWNTMNLNADDLYGGAADCRWIIP